MTLCTPWLFALLSCFSYAFWGLFNGLVNKNSEPFGGLFFSSLGYFIAGLIGLSYINFQPKTSVIAISSGILLGLSTGLGGMFLLLAIQKSRNTSMSVALTALYPIGTLILSYFMLDEQLTKQQIFGCIISVFGLVTMFLKF
jgi:transporter family protein